VESKGTFSNPKTTVYALHLVFLLLVNFLGVQIMLLSGLEIQGAQFVVAPNDIFVHFHVRPLRFMVLEKFVTYYALVKLSLFVLLK